MSYIIDCGDSATVPNSRATACVSSLSEIFFPFADRLFGCVCWCWWAERRSALPPPNGSSESNINLVMNVHLLIWDWSWALIWHNQLSLNVYQASHINYPTFLVYIHLVGWGVWVRWPSAELRRICLSHAMPKLGRYNIDGCACLFVCSCGRTGLLFSTLY
jgi:hypothetical protein